jgi:hypothetical protein
VDTGKKGLLGREKYTHESVGPVLGAHCGNCGAIAFYVDQ